VAVCNRGKPKRDLAEQQYGLKAYDKVEDLIGHGLDFMLIVSTSHAHHDAALQCVEAGVPYLIEKPIALTLGDANDIVEATEKAGLINGVNYSMRYSMVHRKMQDMAATGALGDILAAWAWSFRGHGFHGSGKRHRAVCEPQESGGWIVHHTCHVVDFVMWVAGQVDEAYAAVHSTAPPELRSEELVFATLKFKSGAIGSVGDQVGILREYPAGVIGTEASISLLPVGTSTKNVKSLIKLSKETDPQFHAPHLIDPQDSFEPESGLGHFLKRLKAGEQTDVTVRDACDSLRVCHALQRSAYEGRAMRIEEVQG
jgi:predicted dehydrogenase